MGNSVPVIGIALSVLFGFLPMLVFAYIIFWTDRYEKEPFILLGGVFLWGAIVAAGAAFFINTSLGLGLYLFTGSQIFTEISTSSIFAPVIEECLKGIACLAVFLYVRREFDSILDGIVYAAIAAIGFAATENVYYLYEYGFQENGYSGLIWMFVTRILLVGWQHPFYTAFIGIGLAVARLTRTPWIKIIAPIIGLGIAVLTHSIHNSISTFIHGMNSIAIGVIYDWSGWLAMVIFIIWALYREQRWIITQLGEEVGNGVITLGQYRTAYSAFAQTSARMKALFSDRYRYINRFYTLTAELAYKKHQSTFPEEKDLYVSDIERLRAELKVLSPIVPS